MLFTVPLEIGKNKLGKGGNLLVVLLGKAFNRRSPSSFEIGAGVQQLIRVA